MADENKTGTNGAKAFGGLMAVGLLATWTFMLWQSQASSTGFLERLMDQRVAAIERHVTLADHPMAQTEGITAIQSRVDKLEAWRETWIQTVPALDAKQNERILSLERQTFMGWERP